jgi:L-asparagine transporter-like permease
MKELWFRRKPYGYGWEPCSWQGWLIIALFVYLIIDATFREKFLMVFVWVIVLLAVCYCTGETPRWQWGKQK